VIDIYSPSGKEREILDFLGGYLKRHGLHVTRQPIDDHRYNLVVIPPETEVQLALLGHVDTINAYDLDHYECAEKGGLVYGLGACDMKSGCAAMVEAYLATCESHLSHPGVALAFVVGEEEEGDGASELVKDFHFPWVLIGEPTDLRPCLSNCSYLEVQMGVSGDRIHASLANKRENPIESMLQLILKTTGYLEREQPEAVYNIRDLFSSQATFAVPDRCEAWLDIHLPPMAPIGDIIVELEEIFWGTRAEHAGLDASIRFVTVDAGYELPEKGPLVEALRTVYTKHALPWEPQVFRSHSDASRLWEAGVLPVLLGPGQLEKAHTPDESVSFEQVCLAARLYLDLLVSFHSR
jgi:acetylornithine deacetylase